MIIEAKETIERLRALGDNPMLHETAQACTGCIDNFSQQVGNNVFRRFIIDLLERYDPDEWTDEQLGEYGLVRLPRDADGVTWHIGDESEEGEVIRTLCLYKNGWYVTGCAIIDPTVHRHRKPVTVESVLRDISHEAARAIENVHIGDNLSDAIYERIAGYVDQLRLADEQ